MHTVHVQSRMHMRPRLSSWGWLLLVDMTPGSWISSDLLLCLCLFLTSACPISPRLDNAFFQSYLCHQQSTYCFIADGGCVSSHPPGLTHEAESIPTGIDPFEPQTATIAAQTPLPLRLLLLSRRHSPLTSTTPHAHAATAVSRSVIYSSRGRQRAYPARRAVYC